MAFHEFLQPSEEGAVTIAVLCLGKWRHRTEPAQDHTASEWLRQNLNPDLALKPLFLSIKPHCLPSLPSERDDYSLTLIYLVAGF